MPTQAHPHPVPAPAPTPATTPLTWRYPFPDRDNKEVTSPQIYYQALAGMDDGFFPLGVNGFPHGGIHLNDAAGMFGTKDGVRCIADGHIVAYKIDGAYPHLQFKDGKWAMYSTGFVLVRHTLTLPPAPNSADAQPADESHDIYSLYMHTADWATYLGDEKLKRPWWWLNIDAFRVQPRDRQLAAPDGGATGAAGAFVWTEPKASRKGGSFTAGERTGFLPEGCEVVISETRGQWVHIKTITAGHMVSPVNGGEFGWEDRNVPWKTEGDSATVTPENDWGWLYKPNLQGIKEPDPVGQVVIPPTPVFVKAGTPLGQIGEYHDYERATPLPPTPKRQLLHLEVFADEGFSAFLEKSRARAAQLPIDQRTLLVINAGAKPVRDIAPADRKLCRLHPLYRADLTTDSPVSGPWVKVQPRYGDSTTTLLMPDGPPVWIEREKLATATSTTPAWSRFPLSVQNVADPANAFALVYPRSQLDGLSAGDKAADDDRTHWWRVKFGNSDGQPATGWICEKNHPGTQWQSPWAWPGFEKVDATGIDIADAFRRNLVLTGAADWREQKEFEPSVAAVNGSPLLQKLEHTIAMLAPSPNNGASKKPKPQNCAGKVTARAMQAALRTPWLAQALSHVILRYESEWGGDMSRWDAITPLMRNARDNWQVELQRIRKLQWWNEVKGKVAGFPGSATVHHIHPIGLIANFGGCPPTCKSDVVEFETTEGTFRISHEAFHFILSKEGYKDHPYVPGGDQSSGVTLGYGYDLGQQSHAQIETDLNGIFSPAQITRLQEAAGKQGDHARHIQPSLADIPVTVDMALRLAMVMKRRYAQQTVDAFPGASNLHPHCSGALLDLVINRGPGMEDKPHQKPRAQMRAIRSDVASENLADIPVQLRAMKALWAGTGQGGLISRREDEAVLFEKGMNCNCWR